VVDFHHPHQLQEMLSDFLTVDNDPQDLHQVLSDCKETLKYCVKSGNCQVRSDCKETLKYCVKSGIVKSLLTARKR
jgi:hypothetical protein